MSNFDIIDLHKSDLPGYALVGYGEIGIPLYYYKIFYLYNEKKQLSVLQEFVLNLYKEGLSKKDISDLLAIDELVISDVIASLYQIDFINPAYKRLTLKGNEYLAQNQIDNLERGEMEVLIDSLCGDFDISVNNYMSQNAARKNNIHNVRSYIPQPTTSDIDFTYLKKAYKQFKEKNELNTAGDLIEVIKLEKLDTKYKRVCLMLFQNKNGEVRILAYDRNRKMEKYETILRDMDENDHLNLLQFDIGDYFDGSKLKEIFKLIDTIDTSNEETVCSFKQYNDFFENLTDCTIIIPLIEPTNLTEFFYHQLESKLKRKENVLLFVSGKEVINVYQENFVNSLLSLEKTYENLKVKQIKDLLPSMILCEGKGKICRLEKTEINLKTTKQGILEQFYNLSEADINKIQMIVPELKDKSKISMNLKEIDREEFREKIRVIRKLVIDCDCIIFNNLGIGILQGNSLQGENEFLNIPLATNMDRYKLFLDAANKTLYESIKSNGQSKRKMRFFWNEFKSAYPELQRVIDKIRAYRNKYFHANLDEANINTYRNYMEEDFNGYMPEFVNNGFLYIQYNLIESLENALRSIIKAENPDMFKSSDC